jgi:solute carrier family 25 protein 16
MGVLFARATFEMRKHTEEAAVAHIERIKMQLQSCKVEAQKMKQNYKGKILELESEIASLSNPMPLTPSPAFQDMIDNALSVAHSRLDSLKKAHNQLLRR